MKPSSSGVSRWAVQPGSPTSKLIVGTNVVDVYVPIWSGPIATGCVVGGGGGGGEAGFPAAPPNNSGPAIATTAARATTAPAAEPTSTSQPGSSNGAFAFGSRLTA